MYGTHYKSASMQAMVLFCGKSSFDKELLCPLKRLAESPYATVRRSLACGLHEVSSASWLNFNVGLRIDCTRMYFGLSVLNKTS